MPTEIEELQTLLTAPTPLRTSQRGQPPKAVIEDGKDTQNVDFCQWQVFPNGVYCASGGTQERLPTGAYTILLTQAGLFFSRKKMLTDTLIDLGNSNSLRVVEGIKLFWTRKEHYQRKGVLYKRGILMWGPPGSGKTATLAILVEMLVELGGIVLLVQNPSAAVAGLDQLRKIEPERPLIVVLEDVEEIISSFGEHDLLALLDGEHQTDNVVNIATTNYPEQLGARIINRPSRFDEVIKIGMPSDEMREQYLWRVLGDDVEKYPVAKWVDKTAGMSIAHLKELVIAVTCLDQQPDVVIERLRGMKTTPKSTMYDSEVGFRSAGLSKSVSSISESQTGGTCSPGR